MPLFFQNVYSQKQDEKDSEIDDYFFQNSLHLPTIADGQKDFMKSEVMLLEINQAITRLKTGSSPRAGGPPS